MSRLNCHNKENYNNKQTATKTREKSEATNSVASHCRSAGMLIVQLL